MQKCALGGQYQYFLVKQSIALMCVIFIRAKELETVLNKEEQGMVVPITRCWHIFMKCFITSQLSSLKIISYMMAKQQVS